MAKWCWVLFPLCCIQHGNMNHECHPYFHFPIAREHLCFHLLVFACRRCYCSPLCQPFQILTALVRSSTVGLHCTLRHPHCALEQPRPWWSVEQACHAWTPLEESLSVEFADCHYSFFWDPLCLCKIWWHIIFPHLIIPTSWLDWIAPQWLVLLVAHIIE